MDWIKVLDQSALPPGERQVVKVNQLSIVLLHHNGQLYAVSNRCPHLKGKMKRGKITDDGAILCPLHRSAFDLATGAVKEWCPWPPGIGKALGMISQAQPLQVFPTRVEDNSIWVGVEASG